MDRISNKAKEVWLNSNFIRNNHENDDTTTSLQWMSIGPCPYIHVATNNVESTLFLHPPTPDIPTTGGKI